MVGRAALETPGHPAGFAGSVEIRFVATPPHSSVRKLAGTIAAGRIRTWGTSAHSNHFRYRHSRVLDHCFSLLLITRKIFHLKASLQPGPLPRFICTQLGLSFGALFWHLRRDTLYIVLVCTKSYIFVHLRCVHSGLAFLPRKAVHLTRRLVQTNNLSRQAQQWDAARPSAPLGMAALERPAGRRSGCRMS